MAAALNSVARNVAALKVALSCAFFSSPVSTPGRNWRSSLRPTRIAGTEGSSFSSSGKAVIRPSRLTNTSDLASAAACNSVR